MQTGRDGCLLLSSKHISLSSAWPLMRLPGSHPAAFFRGDTSTTAHRAARPPLRYGCMFHWLHVFNLTVKSLDGWNLKTKFSTQYSLSAVHNVRKFSNFVEAG